jgi:citrate synthase
MLAASRGLDARGAAMIRAALILSADHELNASAFTCRVATSAGAELSKALAAGLCAISGSEHGGATRRIQALVAEVGSAERAPRVVGERMRRGDAIPGFGHRLYPQGDPRCTALLEGARKLGRRSEAFISLQSIVHCMELAGAEPPTLDVGLVAVCSALQLCADAPLAIFALGRLAGLIAHADEQRLQGVMLRPRARFVAKT